LSYPKDIQKRLEYLPGMKKAVGCGAIAVFTAWNYLMALLTTKRTDDSNGSGEIIEHERDWESYIRGFHSHFGESGERDPQMDYTEGEFRQGLRLWVSKGMPRSYTLGNHTYFCPYAPRVLRVHQAGHAPAFGKKFEPLRTERRDNGGLEDEPLGTFDVMLPGDFPHTFVRLTDHRGLEDEYIDWVEDGRIERKKESME
jgi:hypothetical protein